MTHDPATTRLYHITDVINLPAILAAGGLLSDVALGSAPHQVIGYDHIKRRRMTVYRIPCCGQRFVGEFVPFYFCPRSPMLYTVNTGSTGRPAGCQSRIVHLVTTVARAVALGQAWAISDGNAGAAYAAFAADLAALDSLDWSAIRATQWQGRTIQKSAEFLVADRFPWQAIEAIGCPSVQVTQQVANLLAGEAQVPAIATQPTWYYY